MVKRGSELRGPGKSRWWTCTLEHPGSPSPSLPWEETGRYSSTFFKKVCDFQLNSLEMHGRG